MMREGGTKGEISFGSDFKFLQYFLFYSQMIFLHPVCLHFLQPVAEEPELALVLMAFENG